MSTTLAEPELGTITVTIPDTVDQLLELIDEDDAEWILILHESKWFKESDAVRIPFRAPIPAPGTSITRQLRWVADRRIHIVRLFAEGPAPIGRRELFGDIRCFMIPGDIYDVRVTLTNSDPA